MEVGNDEGYGGAAALHAANFGLQEDGGYASGDFCVGVPDGPTTPPRGGGGGDGDGDSGSGGGDDGKCDGKFGGRGAGEGCLWGVRTTQ